MKFSRGSAGNTRTSALALLTTWEPRDGFEEDSRDVKMRKALLALRMLPVRRYGKTAREA